MNKALEEMIRKRFGDASWDEIKASAKVEEAYFHSHEAYPDSVTYDLVAAASRHLGEPPEALLESFGVHWVLHTAKDGYGFIMDLGGKTLPEFLEHLPNLHTRVNVAFPHLNPPLFACRDVQASSLVLRYTSHRAGLAPFVVGILKGLGLRFSTPVHVTMLDPVDEQTRDFLVTWEPSPS